MPELPEVETVKRQLETVMLGLVVDDVEVLSEKSFEGNPEDVMGKRVVGLRRRGKGLVIDLESNVASQESSNTNSQNSEVRSQENTAIGKVRDEGSNVLSNKVSLVIHLKMTGQLIYEFGNQTSPQPSSNRRGSFSKRLVGGHPTNDFVNELPGSHTRVVFKFGKPLLGSTNQTSPQPSPNRRGSNAGVLYFNDQRKFGWIKVVPTDEVEKIGFIRKLGPEPWELSVEAWWKVLQSSRKAVKVRLMDQDKVAGVGNIYANDALWEARIDPKRPANSLTKEEAQLLQEKVKLVLDEGIYYGGATAGDGKYVDVKGLGGKYQEHFRVYQREGEACKRKGCGGVIVKDRLGGRGTFWCETCQK